MRSEQIKAGDRLFGEDEQLVYTVENVTVNRPHVHVTVRFADGGDGVRVFEIGKETTLTRPDSWQ